MRDFLDSTDVIDDSAELRHRLQRDGYVFLRKVIPPNVLRAARRELLAVAAKNGWLLEQLAADEAVVNPEAFCVDPEPAFRGVFRQMYSLQSLHAISHHPNLIGLFERILGGSVLPHPRIQLRAVFPQRGNMDHATHAHQDFLHVQGTTDTFAAWIPFSDCPKSMGPLMIAEGSHVNGLHDFQPAVGYGLVEVTEKFPEDQWLSHDYELGDLSIHHSLTVHRALPNITNRLRLSLDCRYQRTSEPINEKCLNPMVAPLSWEEVYAGWRPSELQYYWRKWKLNAVPFDSSVNRKREELALAAAAQGDRSAIPMLQLIADRKDNHDERRRAREFLEKLEA